MDELERWRRQTNVPYLGFVEDIAALWARAHSAVLPSYREGLPLTLLEDAACARPLIATDVPGCRDIARHDRNAFVVPLGDVGAGRDDVHDGGQEGFSSERWRSEVGSSGGDMESAGERTECEPRESCGAINPRT